jgi:hypothetical protein
MITAFFAVATFAFITSYVTIQGQTGRVVNEIPITIRRNGAAVAVTYLYV